jgi:uncharacterized protein
MIIFLLVFLCLYGGINFYFFYKANDIFHFAGKTEWIIITLLIALVLAPIIIRLAEKMHWETLARIIAYCGYLWMAFVFLFFFFHMTLDIARYAFKLLDQNADNLLVKNLIFSLAVFITLASVVYGFFDAQKIRVQKLEIQTEKILPDNRKIRIVLISDVHIGLLIKGQRLQAILEKVKEAKPDILISTGDLLDGELNNVMAEAKQLAEIKPPYGKYAVTGNHEFYAGIEKSLEFTKQAGFEILRNESKKAAGINIIGLDDPTARQQGFSENNVDLSSLFPTQGSNEFVLLLKHQPTVREDKNFDLQLSGHTHGGQIFPFMFLTRLLFPENFGYHQLNGNKSVYISRGAGTWGPPIRLFAPPEITVIDLINKIDK